MVAKLNKVFKGKGEVKGFTFTQIYSNEKGYVYKVESDGAVHFEMFHIKEAPICVDFKKRIYSETETKEVYPNSKNFGIWAWSVNSVEEGINCLSLNCKV